MVLGEGGAVLLIEEWESALACDALILTTTIYLW